MDSFGTQVCGRYNGIPESEQNRVALWEQVLAGEYPGSQQVSEVSLGGCPWAVTGRIVLERKVGAVGRLSHLPGASACVSYGLCLQDRTKASIYCVPSPAGSTWSYLGYLFQQPFPLQHLSWPWAAKETCLKHLKF